MMAGKEDVGHAEDALNMLNINGDEAEEKEASSENSVSDNDDSSQDPSEKAGVAPANGHYRKEAVDKARRVVRIRRYTLSVSELRCVPFLSSLA